MFDFSLLLPFLVYFVNNNFLFMAVYYITFGYTFGFYTLIFLFAPLFKAFFYSYSSETYVYVSGMIIFVLSCGIAFFGYSLPLGQMSFWAIIVIFNLLSVFPHGDLIIVYLFGGFSPTSRTFSQDYLPFISIILSIVFY